MSKSVAQEPEAGEKNWKINEESWSLKPLLDEIIQEENVETEA